MPVKMIVFSLVTFLHDLFTVVWVGGLITLGIVVFPSARDVLGMGPQTKQLMNAIKNRLSVLIYISIVGLFLTGILKANGNPEFQGLFSFSNPYSTALTLKHILVLIMIAVALYRSLVLSRRSATSTPAQEKQSARLIMLNIILGVAVLLINGFVVALSSG